MAAALPRVDAQLTRISRQTNARVSDDQELSDDPEIKAGVRITSLRIRYLTYGWTLNDIK